MDMMDLRESGKLSTIFQNDFLCQKVYLWNRQVDRISKPPIRLSSSSINREKNLTIFMDAAPPPSTTSSRHTKVGIASFVVSLFASASAALLVLAFLNQPAWNTPGNRLVGLVLWLPFVAIGLSLLGIALGLADITHAGSRKTFGILGLVLSGLTALACCWVFGLIYTSSGGLSG